MPRKEQINNETQVANLDKAVKEAKATARKRDLEYRQEYPNMGGHYTGSTRVDQTFEAFISYPFK